MALLNTLRMMRHFLPGWTARKQDFVFNSKLKWEGWSTTSLDSPQKAIVVGGDYAAAVCSQGIVERDFPGFSAVCTQLESMGCDKHMVTSVLKHLISSSSRQRLDCRMERLSVSKKVDAVLALGITGQDFVEFLEQKTIPDKQVRDLPNNILEM